MKDYIPSLRSEGKEIWRGKPFDKKFSNINAEVSIRGLIGCRNKDN
jgi:hypothetical protein